MKSDEARNAHENDLTSLLTRLLLPGGNDKKDGNKVIFPDTHVLGGAHMRCRQLMIGGGDGCP
jgi:hypothetical protein